jgi:hypothetical protein
LYSGIVLLSQFSVKAIIAEKLAQTGNRFNQDRQIAVLQFNLRLLLLDACATLKLKWHQFKLHEAAHYSGF